MRGRTHPCGPEMALPLQLNRAIRYILYARSRAAGTQGDSPVKGGRTSGGRSEHGQRRKAAMAQQRATNRIQA